MFLKNLFPYALVACFALCLCAPNAAAQADLTRPRQVTQTKEADGTARLENDVFVVSLAEETRKPDPFPAPTIIGTPRLLHFDQMMLNAIDQRIGAPYVFGATGPRVFDCSGFVWSVFNAAGVNFERTNARTFWSEFLPAREADKTRFGTLVFFNNLKHVGIVADERGFYHASSSQGVTYSEFNDYWTSRIVGYRRVPLPATLAAE